MPTTPKWSAAKNGFQTDLNAVNHAAQIDQFLGTHVFQVVYQGARFIVPAGNASFQWVNYGNAYDLAQSFVMVGTTIGRVVAPIKPIGEGADLFVGLYPDSAGVPNTNVQLAGVTIPASWINAMAAPEGISLAGPLAKARFNTTYLNGGSGNFVDWPTPAGGFSGSALRSSFTSSTFSNFMIAAGGEDPVSGLFVPKVQTIEYEGGTVAGLAIPQNPLPQGYREGGIITTPTLVVHTGGGKDGAAATPDVWVASWAPATGVVGSWSQQTPLPLPVRSHVVASWNETIYVVAGNNDSGISQAAVYYTTPTNGQIGAWLDAPPYPTTLCNAVGAVIGNWLVVAGGSISSALDAISTCYYARINPDGSLGVWQTGPSLPTPMYAPQPGFDMCVTDDIFMVVMGISTASFTNQVQALTFTEDGPSDQWYTCSLGHATIEMIGAFQGQSGDWEIIGLNFPNFSYEYTTVTPVPMISVPLAVTGLTPGSTYHVLFRQHQTASASDYLSYGLNAAALTNDAKKGTRHTPTWTTLTGLSMPMSVYDMTNPTAGVVYHTAEDVSATGSTADSNQQSRNTTFTYNRFGLPNGILENTLQPNDPLNLNPTFTTNVANWTPHNGAFVQSNTQVHGGFPFSGRFTPTGGFATASVTSELIPILAVNPLFDNGQWYLANGWVFSTTGWASFSLSVDWYTAASVFISTSSSTVAIAATTWTNYANWFQPPATAAFASINVIESGTPGATNILYLSNVYLTASAELVPSIPSVVSIGYADSPPCQPISITELT